tara:strand:- start:258 stop:443 length:186 start_codon:yes stop_codon:yes gene_type:complete
VNTSPLEEKNKMSVTPREKERGEARSTERRVTPQISQPNKTQNHNTEGRKERIIFFKEKDE